MKCLPVSRAEVVQIRAAIFAHLRSNPLRKPHGAELTEIARSLLGADSRIEEPFGSFGASHTPKGPDHLSSDKTIIHPRDELFLSVSRARISPSRAKFNCSIVLERSGARWLVTRIDADWDRSNEPILEPFD